MQPQIINKVDSLSVSDYYQNLTNFVEFKMKFKGRSINEWQQILTFPFIKEDGLSEEELLKLNKKSIELFEIIYQNASIAKSHFTASKAALEKALNVQKEKIRNDINASKAKMLSVENLQSKAMLMCEKESQAVVMAEIFYDFWEYYIQNIKLYNTRITSLNITKHHEIKNSNY